MNDDRYIIGADPYASQQRATALSLGNAEPDEAAVQADCSAGERGASLVEYALLMALIVVVCVAAIGALGGTTSEPFSAVQSGFGS